MNAPWNAGGNIIGREPLAAREPLPSREPLAAFVGDEASLSCVRSCLADLGWPTARCQSGTLDEAVRALAMAASPTILVVDLSGCANPLEDIQALAQVCEPGTLVIAIGQTNDVQLYRALLASGIHDYLLKPLSIALLAETIATAQASLAAPRSADTGPVRQHSSIAVIGTRGGVGATMLATSLSWLFSTGLASEGLAQPTALLDLDIQFGTGALSLDLDPGQGLVDAIENPARIDGLFIERAMIRASDTLSILSAEAPITAPGAGFSGALLHLAEELHHAFVATVIDLPRNLLATTPQILAELNTVVLVTELTLAGARDTIRILGHLKVHAPLARVVMVANKVPSGICEIGPGDFEAAIERRMDFQLPDDPRVAIAAAKHGQCFAQANQSGPLSEGLVAIARMVCATGDGDLTGDAAQLSRPSLLSRLAPWLRLGSWLTGRAPVGG